MEIMNMYIIFRKLHTGIQFGKIAPDGNEHPHWPLYLLRRFCHVAEDGGGGGVKDLYRTNPRLVGDSRL